MRLHHKACILLIPLKQVFHSKPCGSAITCQHRVRSITDVLGCLAKQHSIGAVLYTSYLQILGILHEPSSKSLKLVYPPPPVHSTFVAGFAAGGISSVIAAPLDALAVRFKTSEVLSGRYRTMWHYGYRKLHEIGPRGVFAGWGLAFIKDSFGYGAFFATFENMKAQAYYEFVKKYYGDLRANPLGPLLKPTQLGDTAHVDLIKPHWTLPPIFLLLAGIMASVSQQTIQHPLSLVQNVHFRSVDYNDRHARIDQPRAAMFRTYYHVYQKTFRQCAVYAKRTGGWRKWLYKGFLANTVKQVPSTSAGLVIFELVRRRYGDISDDAIIDTGGYRILLS